MENIYEFLPAIIYTKERQTAILQKYIYFNYILTLNNLTDVSVMTSKEVCKLQKRLNQRPG